MTNCMSAYNPHDIQDLGSPWFCLSKTLPELFIAKFWTWEKHVFRRGSPSLEKKIKHKEIGLRNEILVFYNSLVQRLFYESIKNYTLIQKAWLLCGCIDLYTHKKFESKNIYLPSISFTVIQQQKLRVVILRLGWKLSYIV